MIIINKNIQVVDKVIGSQKIVDNQAYRLIKYAFVLHVSDGVLIFNNLTKGVLFLTNKEYKNITNISELISTWYLVPDNFNDIEFCRQVRNLNKILVGTPKEIFKFTIFTTTDCNARCFYCYEKGVKKIKMPHKVAIDTANYIIKLKSDGSSITISE